MAQRLRGPAAYLRAAVGRAGDGAPHDQAWCMAFLFFLSGYLALPSLARKGAGPYHVDRLRRFGIPIIVYLFGISPVVTWLVLAAHPGIHPSLLVYWRSAYLSLATIDTGPLWFIWALLLMDVLLVAVARWLRRADLGARPGGTFPTRWRLAAFALALGLTAFVVRLASPSAPRFCLASRSRSSPATSPCPPLASSRGVSAGWTRFQTPPSGSRGRQ